MLVNITHDGRSFYCSARQAAAIDALMNTNAGGFATAKGYVSTSGRVKPEKADITFVSRFRVSNLYRRKIEALEAMTMDDIMDMVRNDPKISAVKTDKLYATFEDRRKYLIESLQKTLDGDRSDAHRQAHDRNYVTLTDGIKVHFKTEKVDGIMVPILHNGLPIVESIMLNIIEISKKIIEPGEYKPVNSGVPVILGNAMERKLPKSCKMKTLSLKEDNFDSIAIGGETVLPEDIRGLYT